MKIGVDLGGSHVGIGLVNEKYEIVDKIERDWTKEEKEDLWNNMQPILIELIQNLLEKNNIQEIEKIGIGFPASKIINGRVYKKDEVIDLVSLLEPIFNTKVYVKNDVKCSGLCEKRLGCIKEYKDALFMTLGTGIGGAYFYENELVVPNKYPGLEIGHMIIDFNGRKCKCGQNGCFEEYASMRVFRNRIKEIYNLEQVNSNIVLELYNNKEKEEEMNAAIKEYIEYLAIGLVSIIKIFEPEAIGIGGSFVYYTDIFLDRLVDSLKEKLNNRTIPEIIPATYKNDAGIIGASMLESN